MTDRYQKIRDALAKGPTPGPWGEIQHESSRWTDIYHDSNRRCGTPIAYVPPYSVFEHDTWKESKEETMANATHIAACDPDTIRALLEERDALREVLGRILENEASDYKAAEEFGGYVLYDELREEARAALGREEGK